VLTDFRYLKDKWRLLAFAVPIGGRAIPLLVIPVRKDGFSKLKWKSEVDLLIESISLFLPLIPKGTVFIFDREFTYRRLMEFLKDKGMNFVIRLKKNVYVNEKPMTMLPRGVYEGVLIHGIVANVYYAYVTSLPKERLSWELYRERMKIEEMFRDEKNGFDLEFLSYIGEEKVLGRWLKVEKGKHRIKLLKEELKGGIISFINFALRIIEILRLKLKISKKGRIVLMIGGIKSDYRSYLGTIRTVKKLQKEDVYKILKMCFINFAP